MRDADRRVFLEVVGREVVVDRADERLEEPPRPARDRPQEDVVLAPTAAAAPAASGGSATTRSPATSSHSASTGAATDERVADGAAPGRARPAAAVAGSDPHRRVEAGEVGRAALRCASLAVRHSSSLRPVTSTRDAVRTIASRLMNASYGSVASANASRSACRANVRPTSRPCWPTRQVAPAGARGPPRPSAATAATGSPTTTSVKNSAPPGRNQPTSSSASSATGTRLRRRLSKIFHRDSAGDRVAPRAPRPRRRRARAAAATARSASRRGSSGTAG